jgi:cobalt/nickel transport protein
MRSHAVIMVSAFLLSVASLSQAEERWQGVDETVVQKFAREHGREARKPLIDTGEGDLQLFMFLLAGTAGGFAAGYCWRALLDGRRKQDEKSKE